MLSAYSSSLSYQLATYNDCLRRAYAALPTYETTAINISSEMWLRSSHLYDTLANDVVLFSLALGQRTCILNNSAHYTHTTFLEMQFLFSSISAFLVHLHLTLNTFPLSRSPSSSAKNLFALSPNYEIVAALVLYSVSGRCPKCHG